MHFFRILQSVLQNPNALSFFQLQNGGGGAGHQELLVAALGADREGGGGMEHGAGAGAGYGFEPHHGYRPHSHSTSVV